MPKVSKSPQTPHIGKPQEAPKKGAVKTSIGQVEDHTSNSGSKILDLEAKSTYLIQTLTKISDAVRYIFGPL